MVRTSILCLSLIAGFVFALAAADAPLRTTAQPTDWPQWRGPDRDGMSPDTGLLKDWTVKAPRPLWTADGMGRGFASITSVGGRIYTTGNQATGQAVVCLQASDGKVLWTKNITETVPKHSYDGSRCSPSIDGERLYAIASSGKIACLKLTDGSEIWSRDFKDWGGRMMSGWGFSESPLVDGDWLLCTPGAGSAMIVALDKLTGKEVWKTAMPPAEGGGKDGAGYASIMVSNGGGVKQYVQLVGRGLIGVRARDGQHLWTYSEIANRTANIPTPLISGDYVFTSSGYGTGAALLKLTEAGTGVKCEEQYFLSGDEAQNHHGQMILKDGYVYFGHRHNNGFPICVELMSGKTVWGGKERGPGTGSAAVSYADGHLVFRYQSGEVALIEATPSGYHLKGSFKPEFTSPPCWAQPVIIHGRLYLRDQDKLMCYDVKG